MELILVPRSYQTKALTKSLSIRLDGLTSDIALLLQLFRQPRVVVAQCQYPRHDESRGVCEFRRKVRVDCD